MASLGYRLPGTIIEEVTEPKSVNVSSSQRTPCFIGLASANIFVKQEQITITSDGVAAYYTYSWDNSTMSFVAKNEGTSGNSITIAFVDPSANSASLSVSVVSSAITVHLATSSTGVITTTPALATAALNSSTGVMALINTVTYTGTDMIHALTATHLAHGVNPPAQDLEYTSYGISSIIAIGSQKGLSDIIEGTHFNLTSNHIVWTTTGLAEFPEGTICYVSYYYIRPESDYKYKEFINFNDVLADLGANIPANTLVMICYIAFKLFNVPKVAVVQIPSSTPTNFINAIDLIKYRDVQTVVPLTTNSQVRTAYKNHVIERSLPDNGRYRIMWTGCAIGTPVGDDSDPTSLRGMASTVLKNERCILVNATRAKYYYMDPDTNTQTYTIVDGSFISAVLAAFRDAYNYPAQNLLGKTVAGIELFDDDYDDYYSEYQMTLCGGSSVFLVQSLGGTMKVVDDLTTDNSTVERNNINIVTAKDYIAKDVAIQMDKTFKGKLIFDRSTYGGIVKNYLTLMFDAYKRAAIIEAVGTITVTLPPARRDTVYIFYSYYAIYTHKYTEGTYAIEV